MLYNSASSSTFCFFFYIFYTLFCIFLYLSVHFPINCAFLCLSVPSNRCITFCTFMYLLYLSVPVYNSSLPGRKSVYLTGRSTWPGQGGSPPIPLRTIAPQESCPAHSIYSCTTRDLGFSYASIGAWKCNCPAFKKSYIPTDSPTKRPTNRRT